MKLKLLALCFTIGLFAFGVGARAAEPKVPQQTKVQWGEKEKGIADVLETALNALCSSLTGLAKHPPQCNTGCQSVSAAIKAQDSAGVDWAALSCCIASAKSFGKISPATAAAITAASTPACSLLLCGPSKSGTLLANACGAMDCNTGYDTVTNCLNQINKTCKGDFALPKDCVLCNTGNCCPDVDGKYCINDKDNPNRCTKNKDGKYQCAAKTTLEKTGSGAGGGW